MRQGEIELIARGLCVVNGHVLLCRGAGAENTYLPGGHIEFGEGAKSALAREMREELGREARIGRFLGAVENAFLQKGERHCEVNLVFAMTIPGISPPAPPAACEARVDFCWAGLDGLGEVNLMPPVLLDLIPRWHAGEPGADWASTY